MATKKKFGWLKWVLIALVLGGGFAGWRLYEKRPKNETPDYKTDAVSRGDVTQMVTANGQLTPVKNVTVGTQVSGIVKEVLVDFNAQVTNGQVIAQIDPSTYEQNITQSEADLASAQAALEYAEMNHRRAKELRANDLVSPADFDKTVVDLHQAEAVLKMRDASLKKSKVDMERTTIYAPIDGVVISRNVDVGQTVAASFNTPTLFQIANDLRKMQIEAMVSEADVGGVQEQQKVNFLVDAYQGRQFHGTTRQVRFAPITNQNVVNYTAVVEVDNRDLKLRPGMTANASIITAQRTNVLRVPNAALRFRPPETAVIASTNDAVAKAAGVKVPTAKSAKTSEIATSGPFAGLPIPPWQAGGQRRRPTDQESSDYEASLTPEQKEKYQQVMAEMRARFAQRSQGGGQRGGIDGAGPGGGGGGPGAMSGGGSRSAIPNDGPAIRMVYLLDKEKSAPDKPVLKAVFVKTGIADGTNTEIQDGLKEGDVLVVGIKATGTALTAPTPNPFGPTFGGGPRR
jgi:HlyD family secretion protein